MKTNKSFTKRFKVTGKKKVLKRPSGQNHFNSKNTGREGLKKKGHVKDNLLSNKVKSLFLPKSR